jgi:glycosyltransferase involved in cell wall biosynthesis
VVDEKLLEYKDMRGGELLGDSGAFKVLFLARLQKAKGIYELIEAVGLLKKKGYNIKLIIAGSGLEESAIRREYKYDWIKMIGYVEGKEKARAYQCADIYVLPSYTEGMPNSVLEAMAFGLPVVCSNVGSLPEIIVEGVNGSIIESIDSEAIATAIERLYMDQDLRKSITENNIKESRRFCSSNVVKRLEVIYRKVISEN